MRSWGDFGALRLYGLERALYVEYIHSRITESLSPFESIDTGQE